MKWNTLLALILVASVALPLHVRAEDRARDNDWLMIPGVRVGPIRAGTSEHMLEQCFGAKNVTRAEIDRGEGDSEPGTVVFADDPERRLEVRWVDPATRTSPAEARLMGDKSLWHLANGVSLGTSLSTLERLNGRPFEVSGWGWDYSGAIYSWNGGHLDTLLPIGRLGVVQLGSPGELTADEEEALLGDGGRPSNLELLHRLDPSVGFFAIRIAP